MRITIECDCDCMPTVSSGMARYVSQDVWSDASFIVSEIEKDILDRRGLKHEWLDISEDIRSEIRGAWGGIIQKRLMLKGTRVAD